jgi:L-lactate permease
MTGLGFSALYASSICLLANTAPVAFGAIGIPVITVAAITSLPVDKLSADVGRICAPISFMLPAYLIAAVAGPAGVWEVWPAVLICGPHSQASSSLSPTHRHFEFAVSHHRPGRLTSLLASSPYRGSHVVARGSL